MAKLDGQTIVGFLAKGDMRKLQVRNFYIDPNTGHLWVLLMNGSRIDLGHVKGEAGGPGKTGKSAYEIAVDNGFDGTEVEWLESLRGATGAPGIGKSAYEIAKDNGFPGTETEWLESLKGAAGAPGYIKEFTKGTWIQIGNISKYYISITKKEHGLTNPYVAKVVLDKTETETDGEVTVTEVAAPIVCKERLLSTGTIKIYIEIDLSEYSDYSGKIYLIGE